MLEKIGGMQIMGKIKALFAGTFHIGESHDAVQMGDSDKQYFGEGDYNRLTDYLKRFSPTKIFVEADRVSQEQLDSEFEAYLNGEYELRQNEIDQIGFRLAKACGHLRVYAADWNNPASDVPDIWNLPSERSRKIVEALTNQAKIEMEKISWYMRNTSIIETFHYVNSAAAIQNNHKLYADVAVLDEGEAEGAAWLARYWFYRNLVIAKQIREEAEPDDRILILYGAGHAYLLGQYLSEAEQIEIVDFSSLAEMNGNSSSGCAMRENT